jgi:hypothetical protein
MRGLGEAREKKLQIPSSKLQRNSKSQTPNKSAVALALVLEAWSFSGAWMLVLGAFTSRSR